MTDVASPPGEPRPPNCHSHNPAPVSALRSSRPKPKRVPTRVSILAPNGSTTSDALSPRSASVITPPGLRVTSTPWSKRLILTLDGGGIRGYSSLIILRALMQEIARIEQSLEPRATSSTQTDQIPRERIPDDVFREGQYLPCHYFDYIAGTSVGGLIAIMLGMQGKTVDECINEFHRQHKAIPLADNASVASSIKFPLLYRRSTWPTKRTRSFFDTFANFTVTATARTLTGGSTAPSISPASSQVSAASSEFRKDVYQCQTLAWCTEVERKQKRPRRPYAFCTYSEEESDISVPEVAKAITTPSRYSFKPFKLGTGQFVDGSKQIRDPTLEVLKEITSLLDESGGTSHDNNSTDNNTNHDPPIDLLLSLGTDEYHAWFYEKLRGLTTATTTTNNNNPETDKTKTKSTTTRPENGGDTPLASATRHACAHYARLEVPPIKLGWRRAHVLREIEAAAHAWLDDENTFAGEEISRWARMLVERRRARAATARWETFALGVRYVCFHAGCDGRKGGVVTRGAENGGDGEEEGEKMPRRVFESRGDFFDHLDRRHQLLKMAGKGAVDVEEELDKGRRFGCI